MVSFKGQYLKNEYDAFHMVQLQSADKLYLQCNVPLTRGLSAIAEPLVNLGIKSVTWFWYRNKQLHSIEGDATELVVNQNVLLCSIAIKVLKLPSR